MKGYALLAAFLSAVAALPSAPLLAAEEFESNSGGITIRPGENTEKEVEFKNTFPDENFRKYLNTIGLNANTLNTTSGNKILNEKTEINLSGYSAIENLEGINKFTQLKTLTITGNSSLVSLDLRQNQSLLTLVCSNNKELRSINLPNSVTKLTCEGNENLFSLDLTSLTVLTELSCKNQKNLRTLTLPTANSLTDIDCSGGKLATITNLGTQSNLVSLNCSNNGLTTLNVSSLNKLKKLLCNDNKISSLTVSVNLESLNCSNNQLASLNLLPASKLINPIVNSQRIPCLDDKGKVNLADLVGDYTSKIESISNLNSSSVLPNLIAADPVNGTIAYLYRTKYTNNSSDAGKDILMKVNLVKKNSAPASSEPTPEDPTTPVNGDVMKRLYNPNSGEHFYTSNPEEASILISKGWESEGTGWIAPASSGKPVYRLYNANAGDHHYTVDLNERDTLVTLGWKDEGIGWYSADASGVPVYRQYNPNAKSAGAHHYTVDANEASSLVSNGWKEEGIAWYGVKN